MDSVCLTRHLKAGRELRMLIWSEPSNICNFSCTSGYPSFLQFGLPSYYCDAAVCLTTCNFGSSMLYINCTYQLTSILTTVNFRCGMYQTLCDYAGVCAWETCQTLCGESNNILLIPISSDSCNETSYRSDDSYDGSRLLTHNHTACSTAFSVGAADAQ